MKGCNHIFYTPELQYPDMPHGEMCGDLMPCYHDGIYTFLFLYKYCIYAVDTADFVTYENFRIVLQNGTPEEQDWHAATGSVCKKDDVYYFYYTGFCEGNRGEEGKYEQAILRARSIDLIRWEKDRDYIFYPDEEHYAGRHWRDPNVFYHEGLGMYCMQVTACEKDGNHQRSGCCAVYVSDDMLHWSHYKTTASPRIWPTMECQDAFQIGARWYLTFSTYEKMWETRYMMADSFDGPWRPSGFDDKFDGRDFYAAKTVSDGTRRYLVGWQSIRKGCTNSGRYVWGGNVVVHELVQRENGELGVKLPDSIAAAFHTPIEISCVRKEGDWDVRADGAVCGRSEDGFGWAELAPMAEVCLIRAKLFWTEGTKAVGFMFHTNGAHMEQWCQLRLDIQKGQFSLERSGKTEEDQFFEETRPIRFRDGVAEITLITSHDSIVAYVDDAALCGRCYGFTAGSAGVFVEYGGVVAENVRIDCSSVNADRIMID